MLESDQKHIFPSFNRGGQDDNDVQFWTHRCFEVLLLIREYSNVNIFLTTNC